MRTQDASHASPTESAKRAPNTRPRVTAHRARRAPACSRAWSRRSGHGAIATAANMAGWRQPIENAPAGRYRTPEARHAVGGRERSERGKRSRGRGAPASQRGATAREEPRAPAQFGRERAARDGSRRQSNTSARQRKTDNTQESFVEERQRRHRPHQPPCWRSPLRNYSVLSLSSHVRRSARARSARAEKRKRL